MVRRDVGPYHLVATQTDVADGEFRPGSVDSLGLKYRAQGSGTEVKHILIAYASAAQAAAKPALMVSQIRREAPSIPVAERPYRDQDGKLIGTVTHVQGNPEMLLWSNNNVFLIVTAPTGHGVAFFKEVPY